MTSPVASANRCEILSRLFIGSFNLVAAQRMSKPRTTNSSEGRRLSIAVPGNAIQREPGLAPKE